MQFFANQPKIARKLQTLLDVGLGYVTLGQSATTLSGGEAQRVKLANELARRSTGKTVYILDEPTDQPAHCGCPSPGGRCCKNWWMRAIPSFAQSSITLNLDQVCRSYHRPWPGGEAVQAAEVLVAAGTPEQVAAVPGSFTGQYLRPLLERDKA